MGVLQEFYEIQRLSRELDRYLAYESDCYHPGKKITHRVVKNGKTIVIKYCAKCRQQVRESK